MSKELLHGEDTRLAIQRGVDKLANAVKVTLGPKGRNVAISRGYGMPYLTKDGVTVAKEVDLKDPYENIGAQIVKQAAMRTNDIAGDGTTTATILAQALVRDGMKRVAFGESPLAIKREWEEARVTATERLKTAAKPVGEGDVERVASISANDPVVGKVVAEVSSKVGLKGVITVTEGRSAAIETEVVQGMRWDRGFVSPYMQTNPERGECALEEPYVFVTDKKLSKAEDIIPVIKAGTEAGRKNFLFVCDDLDGEALAVCVINKMKGNFNVLAAKAPGYADRRVDLLGDIAALVGAKLITSDAGRDLGGVTIEDLGTCERVVGTKDHTTIIGGRGSEESCAARVAQIEALLGQVPSDFDASKLKERLAGLTGGIGVIRVGAATEVEMKELKHRIEDAVLATKCAMEEGVITGGGVALLAAATDTALEDVCEEPLRVLATNQGEEAHTYLEHLGPFALTLVEGGIIDPVKVTRVALENAVSVAGMLLTTECMITEVHEKPAQAV